MYFHTALLLLTAAFTGGATANILVRSVTTTTLIYLTPTTTPTLMIYPTWTKNSTTVTYPGTGTIRTSMNHTMTMSYNTTSMIKPTQSPNTTVTRTVCDQQNRCSVIVTVGPTVTATGAGTGVVQPTMTPFTSGIGHVVASGGWVVAVLCGAMLLL